MPSVGRVDRAPVLDPLGHHEGGVERRHREDHQWEEQRDDSGRLQHALDRDAREQQAEEVGARVAHEDRGRVEVVAQEAHGRARHRRRQDPGFIAIQRERNHREGDGGDRAHPRGQPVDAVGEVHDVHHRDHADQREQYPPVAEVERVDERQRDVLDPHVGEHGDGGGRELAGELYDRGQPALLHIVHGADQRYGGGARENAAGLPAPGNQHERAGQHTGQDRQPAEAGGGRVVQAALAGKVDRPDTVRHPRGDWREHQRHGTRDEERPERVELVHPGADPSAARGRLRRWAGPRRRSRRTGGRPR